MRTGTWLLGLALLASLSACGGSSEVAEADTGFGSRVEEDENRETMLLAPPDSAQEYFYYPAYFSELDVRTGPFENGRRPVELFLKGALPDGCTALHDLRQTRRANLIEIVFEMRRPKGAMCTQVVRPYRFYYMLDEALAPGDYTLKLNDTVRPFTVPRS
ncbi:MAG: hypothetical protein AAGI91_12745 [Bacteroidota bacterium]